MGIIWRFTMVLLSTLAALVIIVNSAEEEYEAHYRRELRPSLDTVTPRTYEQPWRTMKMEQTIQSHEDRWDDRTEEPLRRRRLTRKRKRQPESSSAQDTVSQERYGLQEKPIRPYADTDFSADRKMTETPKRRRKKLDFRPNRWEETTEQDRPMRRRGQRRKRPAREDSPEISEFGEFYPSGGLVPVTQMNTERSNDDFRHFEDNEDMQIEVTHDEHTYAEEARVRPNLNDEIFDKPDIEYTNKQNANQKRTADSDDDFSDITEEDLRAMRSEEEHAISKEKLRVLQYRNEKAKEKVDPLTLKDILKRSNGTSLSEILQQHNLSLTDLLHGKDKVLSILKSEESLENSVPLPLTTASPYPLERKPFRTTVKEVMDEIDEPFNLKDVVSENPITDPTTEYEHRKSTKVETIVEETTTEGPVEETSKPPNIRRYPTSIRRKQRIRPVFNSTLKSQLSRDMLALNARKYFNHRRRNSSHEWRELIPMMKKNITKDDKTKKIEFETTTITEETTTVQEVENCTAFETETERNNISETLNEFTERDNTTHIDKNVEDLQSAVYKSEKPIIKTTTEPMNSAGLRRQAFNNRLKKKRMRQKNLTTEPPQDDIMKNLFGMPNLVSSSEFISQTQIPKTSIDDVSILEDFLTTEMPRKHHNKTKGSRFSPSRSASTSHFVIVPSSTEESAKIEIEEILNDSMTSVRLSRILKERNMTLNELVEHRERGSSHVHLADIFHNASKEPNSPEPFLSKLSIEPISKETYPLRALLDANTHDTTAKATTYDSPTISTLTTEVNIPVKMDFRNNVNENAENMGFMSFFPLFKNITNKKEMEKTNLKKDSEGTFYETSITVVNTTDAGNGSDTLRESRVIQIVNDNNNQDDIVSWNDIFTLMRKNHENISEESQTTVANGSKSEDKNIKVVEDLEGDGLIVLEDLQKLNDLSNKFGSTSDESLDFRFYEDKAENPKGILDKLPNQTKSVTIATASIAGLAMVLFLLTYVGYRWHQQRSLGRKKSFSDERVPSPVFENRKGHKHNSSTRSISPMLSSSNIYTLNTLDSRNGKESPDYMWDSLRKPF